MTIHIVAARRAACRPASSGRGLAGQAATPRSERSRRSDGAGRRAFDHAVDHPSLQERDLRVGQPAHADEFSNARLRFPRRHVATPGGGHHLRGMLPHVRVRQQAERRRALRPMTGSTVRQHDRLDVLRERHRRGHCGSGLRRTVQCRRCARPRGFAQDQPPPGQWCQSQAWRAANGSV